MPSRKGVYSSLLALALVGGGLAAGWYAAHENNRIRACPARYCYHTFSGPVNATLYVTDVADSGAYLRYYRAVRQGRNPVIDFPLQGLDPLSPVYVQRWLGADSALAEVVNYDEGHDKRRPYRVACYVDALTLHTVPPPKPKKNE